MSLISWVISLVVVGLVIGALGRLVIPGRNNVSIPATIGIGIVGSLVGAAIGAAVGTWWIVTVLLEIAIAGGLVYVADRRSLGS